MENVGIVNGPLEYITAIVYILWSFGNLVVIWYISPHFGKLHHEKSGNPVRLLWINDILLCGRGRHTILVNFCIISAQKIPQRIRMSTPTYVLKTSTFCSFNARTSFVCIVVPAGSVSRILWQRRDSYLLMYNSSRILLHSGKDYIQRPKCNLPRIGHFYNCVGIFKFVLKCT
jgi:hypothetical protein